MATVKVTESRLKELQEYEAFWNYWSERGIYIAGTDGVVRNYLCTRTLEEFTRLAIKALNEKGIMQLTLEDLKNNAEAYFGKV